jgi:hypothetical protein
MLHTMLLLMQRMWHMTAMMETQLMMTWPSPAGTTVQTSFVHCQGHRRQLVCRMAGTTHCSLQ